MSVSAPCHATVSAAPGARPSWALADPVLLAFDTSTEVLALAVSGPAGRFTLLAEGGANASATLLPHAQRLLAQAGVGLHQLQAVAFGGGPGAFTGLRTACAVAQGLGLGLGLPLLPIDSLMIVAEDARQQRLHQTSADQTQTQTHHPTPAALDVTVLMDARMQEVYAARYRHADATGWQVLQPPALCTLPALAQALVTVPVQAQEAAPMHCLAGSALLAFADRLPLPPTANTVATEHNRAAALLQLAVRAWADGQAVDAALALPLYLRDKVAQTTAEREAVRQSALEAAAQTVRPGDKAPRGATGVPHQTAAAP